MNEIVKKFLLAGDKCMPEMHLKQPTALHKQGFTYIACGPLLKQRKNSESPRNRRYKLYLQNWTW